MRQQIIYISFGDLAKLLSGEQMPVGVPAGAKVEGVRVEPKYISVKLSHSSFPLVNDGDRIPDANLALTTGVGEWV